MTTLTGPGRAAAAAVSPAAAAPPPGLHPHDVVHRAPGLRLLGRYEGSGYVEDRFLAVRSDGQTVMLTPLLHAVLECADGGRGADDLAAAVGDRLGRAVGLPVLSALVLGRLGPAGLVVVAPPGAAPALRQHLSIVPAVDRAGLPTADPLLATTLRRPLLPTRAVDLLGRLLAPLFDPRAVAGVLALWLCGSLWLFDPGGLLAGAGSAFTTPGGVLSVLGLLLASTLFHELGHAAGCAYGGARPGAIGAGLYLWVPVFWTDVTDAYRLDRAGRLRTDLGGVYFNAVSIVAMTGLAMVTGWAPATGAALLTHGVILQQLLPVVRMDGYYLFGDLTGVPNPFAFTRGVLRGLVPGRGMPAQVRALRRGARAAVVGWVVVTVPLLGVMLGWLVLSLPSLVGSSWQQGRVFWADATGAQGLTAAALAWVCILLLVLPLLGLAALLARVVQRLLRLLVAPVHHRAGRTDPFDPTSPAAATAGGAPTPGGRP
ncbi:hypothetical protein [Kineosporia sp. A_224]|uniref:hypothetical protein n=1 Tax=Kineosporia sp. A_224 TaxID=1962180 RepID=UPI000B4B8E5B|nr:hypothetical protein [Kineosporia sp. A_224]